MPSKHINNSIFKRMSKKHNRTVTKYYHSKQIHSLLHKAAIQGKKHGIQIGSMAHFKQETSQELAFKNTHKPSAPKSHPDNKDKKVGSRGKSALAKPLKAAKKAIKSLEKIGKKIHVKK